MSEPTHEEVELPFEEEDGPLKEAHGEYVEGPQDGEEDGDGVA